MVLLLLLQLLFYFLLLLPPCWFGTAVNNFCPSNQFYYGPCIANSCPPSCPLCTCVGGRDCCTPDSQQGTGGNGGSTGTGGGGGARAALLRRLLLALLLSSSPGPIGQGQLGLVLCRNIALNCALFSAYCLLPAYALCMRTHCAATCGLCADDQQFGFGGGNGLLGPLLLSLLGLGDTGNSDNTNGTAGAMAVRAGIPPIRLEQEEEEQVEGRRPKNNGTRGGGGKCSRARGTTATKAKAKTAEGGGDSPRGTNSRAQQSLAQRQFFIPPGLIIPNRQRVAAILRRLRAVGKR